MVPAHNLVAFAAAAWLIIVIPGPSVLFTVSRALAHGRRTAVATVLGNAAGEGVQAVAVAVGLGALVAESMLAYSVIKLVGAAYIIYLGVQAIRHRSSESTIGAATPVAKSAPRAVREGFVVGLANPKTMVFMAAILPQFVDRAGGAVTAQLLTLGAVFVVIAVAMDSVWALGAGAARDWFARSPQRLGRLGALGGVVMIGLGVRLAVGGRPD